VFGLAGLREIREKAPEELLQDVRIILREKFLSADVGIIGANFLVAETGANVLVSNEGNADLSALLPKTQIILASIEKVLPRMADTKRFLRLLCMSATGQMATAYQSFYLGKNRGGQWDGSKNVHIILLDNNRCRILFSPYRPILRCFCRGACMDNCPVYSVIGGHPYDLSGADGRDLDITADGSEKHDRSCPCLYVKRPLQ
jgi:L-lactate dehydrogenase complex protein LldF